MRARVVAAAAAAVLVIAALAPARADGESREPGPWDDVVFLPEKGLNVLLERDPRGVLLDRATYLDLYRRARAARGTAPDSALAGPTLLRSEVTGVVEGDRAKLTVRLSVAHRGAERALLPLRLGGSVVSATLDGAPATLGSDAKGGLTLAVAGDGLHEVVVELVAPVTRKQGAREVVVALPDAPASRWTLDIPGRAVATAGEALFRVERLTGPDRTRIVAFGAGATLRANWREGDQGTDLPPLVRTTMRTLAEVGERALDITLMVSIECLRSPRDSFPLWLGDPTGPHLAVLGVEGEGVSLVPPGENLTKPAPYTLQFAEPFTGTRTVMIRLTRPLDGPGTIDLPVFHMPGAETLDRTLAVQFTDGLRGFVEPGVGAVAVDPATAEAGGVTALLRLDRDSAAPRATSERPAVRLRADARILLDLADDGPWLAASFLYEPRGDRLYGVDPLLPAGFLPETITVSGDRAFLRGTTPDGRITLVFPGGVAAGSAVTVTMRGRWPVPGWGVEDAPERTAPLPRVDAGTGVETEGWLGVAVPPGVEVREEVTTGLTPAPISELRERAGYSAEGLTLGWRFRGLAPGGSVRAIRPEPSVTSNVTVLVTPAEDHLTFEGSVRITVQRSGVREARIRVQPSIGDLLRFEGPDIAERRRVSADGVDTWTIRFTRLVRDGTVLGFRAELPLTDGAASVPAVALVGAARSELLVGVSAAGELDVKPESEGLRVADPAEFAPILGPGAAALLRTWKGEPDVIPTLVVRTTRLPPAPLPSAFADGITLRTTIGMDGIARTRLDAAVRNADRQALEVRLPPGARLSSARVAGEAVKPVRTAAGVLLVPIVPSVAPFAVTLVYEEPVGDRAAATLVAPDLGIPGSQAVWTVHLPEGSVVTSTDGQFSTRPLEPGTPLVLRWLEVTFGPQWQLTRESAGPPMGDDDELTFGSAAKPLEESERLDESESRAARPRPASGRAPAPDPAAPPPPATMPPPPPKPPEARIEARAAQRGLFGMDLRLLAAGPSVTATRLGPTGSLTLGWRTVAGRATLAAFAAIAAFGAAVLARRRGVGAPTWTVLALAAFTTVPMMLGLVDTSAWDAAAAATLLFAAVMLVRRVGTSLLAMGGTAVRFVLRRIRRRKAVRGTTALLLVLAFAASARAADPPAKAPPDPPERVYVPYDPSRPETVRTPEQVFLPYARYRELWNAAHPEERIEAVAPPVVVAASYDAKLDGRVLVVAARFEIDPVNGGVVALPPGAAADDIRLDERPATATASAPGGATLVSVPRGVKAGARTVLQATLRWPVAGEAPGGSLRAPIPRAPSATLSLVVPVADAVVSVAAIGGWTVAPDALGTRITADLGPIDVLDVSWQPRGADAAGGRTRFEIDSESTARLRPGLLEWTASVTLKVVAGTVSEIEAPLPAGIEIQSVDGPGVASWTVVASADGQSRDLRIRLLGAGPGEQKIAISGLMQAPQATAVVVPDIAFRGAGADRARVVVSATNGRLAVVETVGVERTDAGEAGKTGAVAFRRVRTPSRLTVRVDALADELRVASRQHLHVGAEASLFRAEFDLTPGPRGLFEARIGLPVGWTLDDASGAKSFPGASDVRLVFDGSPAQGRRVTLVLRGPAPGADAMPFPVLRVAGATRETADLLVSTAPGFAVVAEQASGLDAVPAATFAEWPALDASETRALAWRDARGGGSVAVRREALRPTIQPTVIADVTILDERIIVDALIHWVVRGGVERTFRVDAPVGIGDAWVLGDGLREVRREMVNGRERLTVTMQAAATGSVDFRVLYDLPVPPGGIVDVTGPEPVGGEGGRAFLMLRALGESEVEVTPTAGLETCDVADLPLVPQGLDPLSILRFLRARDAAWTLPLKLTTHEFGDLPDARIHLVEGTTVADRDGSARTRVDVRLFSRARSFLPVELPQGATLEVVLVSGVPVRPVTRPEKPGVVQVPVRVQSLGEESQVVSLTFRTPPAASGERFGTLEPRLPSFPGVHVDGTTWRVLLPEDRDYSFSGNMDEVEAVEYEIAKAEAYAYDVQRLRSVLVKGNKQQQQVAIENLVLNTAELRQSLDSANARLGDLERAAAEGRVSATRVAESRRKAQELAKEIEGALADVEKNSEPARQGLTATAHGGQYRGPGGEVPPDSREPSDPPPSPEVDADRPMDQGRFGTRAGQSGKKWGTNSANLDNRAQAQTAANKQTEATRRQLETYAKDEGKSAAEAQQAQTEHAKFDDFRARQEQEYAAGGKAGSGGLFEGPTTGGGDRGDDGRRTVLWTQGEGGSGPGTPGATTPFFGGSGGGGGTRIDGTWDTTREAWSGAADTSGAGGSVLGVPLQGQSAGTVFRGGRGNRSFFGSGITGGGGGGGILDTTTLSAANIANFVGSGSGGGNAGGWSGSGLAPGYGGGGGGGGGMDDGQGVEGLISLAPPLVERGRAYSFRKLDASAELTITTRRPGLSRRLGALAALAAVVAAVWLLRRRSARRASPPGTVL